MNIDMPIKKQNKVKNFIKENKVNIYIFLAMLIFTIIICSNFFNMHFHKIHIRYILVDGMHTLNIFTIK